ncbi:MAG: MATE family efflux transporter [Phycisphaeraceae bacterium]
MTTPPAPAPPTTDLPIPEDDAPVVRSQPAAGMGTVPQVAGPDGGGGGGFTRRRARGGPLAGLSLPRRVFVLALWPFLEQMLNFLVGTVDFMLAGRLGDPVAATNALGVAGYVGWLMGILHAAVGVGATAIIARAIGGRHRGKAQAALGQAMLLALASGLAVGVTIFALAPAIGRTAGLADDDLILATLYLRSISLTAPLASLLFVGGAAMRGAGDTRTPFLIMLAVNIVNVGASVLLVYAPLPLGGYGFGGIAVGTAIAWAVGGLLTVGTLLGGRGGGGTLRLRWARMRPHGPTLKQLVRIGVPNLAESIGMWGANFIILMMVGRLALDAAIGAQMLSIRVESISLLTGMAMGVAAATLTGQYLGAGDVRGAKHAVYLCWAWCAAIMTACGLVFIFMPEMLVRMLSDAPEHLEIAPPLLRISGTIQIFFGTSMVLSHAMRGAGETRGMMIVSYVCTYAVRLPAIWLVAFYTDLGLVGIWLVSAAELVLRSGVLAWCFFRGRWARLEL